MKPIKLAFYILIFAFALPGCSTPLDSSQAEEREWESPEAGAPLPTADRRAALPTPLCGAPQSIWITDTEVRAPPKLDEPAPRTPFRDPVFEACLVRVTDRKSDPGPEDSSGGMKNEYARVGAFNADGSRLIVYAIDGFWYLYDAASLQPLGELPLYDEPRWDAQDPNVIYFIEERSLMAYNILSAQTSLVRDFATDLVGHSIAAVWTVHEGRPSMDTRYFGLIAEDENWLPSAFLIYDRVEDKATIRDLRGMDGIQEDIDHVTISPKGTYFLASFDRFCQPGQMGSDANPCGLMVYDRNLQNGRGLLRIVGHYDTALDAAGREVVIFQNIDTDEISLLDLENGSISKLFPIDFSHSAIGFHFSGLAYDRPGWALVSTYEGGYPKAFTWMDDQVFAVELKPGGRILRLAHTHSKVDPDQEHDYWAEPHATVNHDFTRILFTSNWGRSGTEEVDVYLIELPQDWFQ